jgi:hypothetical protein
VDSLILGWIGGKPVEYPYIIIGQIATVIYFGFFLVIIPFLGTFEKWLIKLWLKSERFSTNNTLYTSGANNL